MDTPTPDAESTAGIGPWIEDAAEHARSRANVRQRLFGGVAAPVQIGRYVVRGTLGRGGMGVVYRAWDPELDRRVAIKLVHVDATGPRRLRARVRLVREGQAMAKLAHPNVVTVFDAGTHGDDVFIAMEHVEGTNLASWVRARGRSWREILEVFVGAGRGLAAAHAAGVIHRDFKPANVVVGDDGRARVLDFGLSRAAELRGSSDDDDDAPPREPGDDAPLTEHGALVGTPAYMAPERLRGAAGDAASDQFAFAVALHEALAGRLPFPLVDRADLPAQCERIRAGAPTIADVPRRVQRILARALAHDARDRFATMDALIDALIDDPWQRARRVATAGLATIAVAALAWQSWQWSQPARLRVRVGDGELAGVRVLVDGREVDAGSDGAIAVAAGLHRIRAEREGWEPAETIVEAARGTTQEIALALVHEQGQLDIEVEPRGAVVEIDGVGHGSPLVDHRIDTGSHTLRLWHEGYYEQRFPVEVAAGATTHRYVALAPGLMFHRAATGINFAPFWLGDLDGDGRPELAHRNFNTVRAYDPWKDRELWSITLGSASGQLVVHADLDGDAIEEIVGYVQLRGERMLAVWNATAAGPSPELRWKIVAPARDERLEGAPLVVDLDGDGRRELVAHAPDGDGLLALAGRDGARRWQLALPGEPVTMVADPSPGGPTLVVATTAEVLAVDADGRRAQVRWRAPSPFTADPAAATWAAKREIVGESALTLVDLDATLGRDVLAVVPGGSVALAGRDGSVSWRREQACSAVLGHVEAPQVWCRTEGGAIGIDGEGHERWRHGGRALGALAWNGRPVVALAQDDATVVLDAATGERRLVLADDHLRAPLFTLEWTGDGRDELALCDATGVVAFTEQGTVAARLHLDTPPERVAAAVDVDHDGLSELLVDTRGPQLVAGPRILWRRRSADALRSRAVARDFDGDGRVELAQLGVFRGPGSVYLLDGASGILELVAEQTTASTIRAPAIIDGPAGSHDLAAVFGEVLVRVSGRDGHTIARTPMITSYATPAVTDLDGDGHRELLVVGWDSDTQLVAVDAETLTTLWRRPLAIGSWAAPLVLDGRDGVAPELVLPRLDGVLEAMPPGPDGASLWQTDLGARNSHAPALVRTRAAAILVTSVGHGVETVDDVRDLVGLDAGSGAELWRWPTEGAPRSQPAIIGDAAARLQVVHASRGGRVTARGLDGALVWRFEPGLAETVGPSTAVVAADLDHDGTDEIVASFDGGRLRVLDGATGVQLWEFATEGGAEIEAPPLAVDVDGDGIDELVVGSHDRFLYCLRHRG